MTSFNELTPFKTTLTTISPIISKLLLHSPTPNERAKLVYQTSIRIYSDGYHMTIKRLEWVRVLSLAVAKDVRNDFDRCPQMPKNRPVYD
jgi:hypothetical protein